MPVAENSQKNISGLQKGPAERGHVKKRQKSSKSVKKFFDNFRAGQKSQKSSKSVKKFFDNFRAAPFFRPSLGGSENTQKRCCVGPGQGAGKTPEKQPKKQCKHPKNSCFAWLFCLPGCFACRLFFGCFSGTLPGTHMVVFLGCFSGCLQCQAFDTSRDGYSATLH